MNLLSLYYFVELAKELHVTNTAQKLYISQQNLSQHIQRLEHTTASRSFTGSQSSLSPTQANSSTQSQSGSSPRNTNSRTGSPTSQKKASAT